MMRVTVSICTRRFENLTPSLLEPWGRYPAYMTYMVTHTDDINFTKKKTYASNLANIQYYALIIKRQV